MENERDIAIRNISIFQEEQAYSTREIQKILFTLSTGTFVLSISFIGYVKTSLVDPGLLILAWVFLGLAIFWHTLLHYQAEEIARIKVRHANAARTQNNTPPLEERLSVDGDFLQKSDSAFVTRRLAMSCMTLGLVCLMLFTIMNLMQQYDLKNIEKLSQPQQK